MIINFPSQNIDHVINYTTKEMGSISSSAYHHLPFKNRVWLQGRSRSRGTSSSRREVMGRAQRIPGIDEEMTRLLNANMDQAPARRRARQAFQHIQLGIDHLLFKTPCDGLKMKESYEVNSKGLEIFTKSWLPRAAPPKAVVCYCHGYGDTCTFLLKGLQGSWLLLGMEFLRWTTRDSDFQKVFMEDPDFSNLPSFLFGQSLGGAVALNVHFKQPKGWSGAILVAPMCKISDDLVPPLVVKKMLIGLASILPKKKLVPQKDLAEAAFRDLKKREQTAYNVIAYGGKPRLRTAVEMLKATEEIESRLEEVSLSVLVLHGEADTVTDPSVSKALHEKASSSDKTLKLYKDAYHSLLEGEPDETTSQVLNDIICWLDERSNAC